MVFKRCFLKDEDLETIDEWYEVEDVPTELDPIEDTDIVEGEENEEDGKMF